MNVNAPVLSTFIYQTVSLLRSEEHTSESSHDQISYAVFCLKKKKNKKDRNFTEVQSLTVENSARLFFPRYEQVDFQHFSANALFSDGELLIQRPGCCFTILLY